MKAKNRADVSTLVITEHLTCPPMPLCNLHSQGEVIANREIKNNLKTIPGHEGNGKWLLNEKDGYYTEQNQGLDRTLVLLHLLHTPLLTAPYIWFLEKLSPT